MLRFSLALTTVAIVIGSSGCTHCDTCDDFPLPCIGGNCGGAGGSPTVMPGPFAGPGIGSLVAPYRSTSVVSPAPPESSTSPFSLTAPVMGGEESAPAPLIGPAEGQATPATSPEPSQAPREDTTPVTVPVPMPVESAPKPLAKPVSPVELPAPVAPATKPGDAASSALPLPIGPEATPSGGF